MGVQTGSLQPCSHRGGPESFWLGEKFCSSSSHYNLRGPRRYPSRDRIYISRLCGSCVGLGVRHRSLNTPWSARTKPAAFVSADVVGDQTLPPNLQHRHTCRSQLCRRTRPHAAVSSGEVSEWTFQFPVTTPALDKVICIQRWKQHVPLL